MPLKSHALKAEFNFCSTAILSKFLKGKNSMNDLSCLKTKLHKRNLKLKIEFEIFEVSLIYFIATK